jgi:hypothetical protein
MIAKAKKDKVTVQKTTAKKIVVRKSTNKKAAEKALKTVSVSSKLLGEENHLSLYSSVIRW